MQLSSSRSEELQYVQYTHDGRLINDPRFNGGWSGELSTTANGGGKYSSMTGHRYLLEDWWSSSSMVRASDNSYKYRVEEIMEPNCCV